MRLARRLLLAALVGHAGAAAQTLGPPDPRSAPATEQATPRPPAVGPALYEAVQRATDSYPAVQSQRGSVRAADQEIRAAKQLALPRFGVQGVALGTGDGLGSQLVADQPVYTFGRIGAQVDRARAERMARAGQVDETVLRLALDVTDAYFTIARLARRASILEANLKNLDTLVGSIRNRVDAEVSPATDLALARSRASQTQQELALTRAQQQAAVARIRQFLGDASYDPGAVPTYDPAIHHPQIADAIEAARRCSPARGRLAAQAMVAQADARIARKSLLPQLSAQASYNDIVGARVGLAVTAQTQGGLSDLRRADAARERASAAGIDVQTAERETIEQVSADLVENAAARDRIDASKDAADTADQVTASFYRQFVAGRRTWLDVMNAVREAAQARLGESDAEITAMASSARLLLRTCTWQPQGRLLGEPAWPSD
ncbi:TolC family protein [Sphingomonas sp. Y38-1Y]|uniref:TolC family protein n=1 Tax=Sphingomonas sp. Y38-1Y TaxID=3078265 RepID=UPI0028E3F2B7|nr:TolC family protein [Sphingomonas sp. Y38-1Y]